jgi:cobalamin biosynthesis protein CobD/CbiB
MKEIYRRGITGVLALVLNMNMEQLPEGWSPSAVSVVGLLFAQAPRRMPANVGVWLEAGMLSTTLGMNALRRQVESLIQRLHVGDLAGARHAGAPLLQRDTGRASEAELASGAIAALADRAADDVIAPLFFYLFMGLPGALFYRMAVCVKDSLGPRATEIVHWMRLIPSQITGALFVAAAYIEQQNGVRAWRIWRRDGCRAIGTPHLASRSALAGALSIELVDNNRVVVGAGEREAQVADVGRAQRLFQTAMALAAGFMLGVSLVARRYK